MNNQLNRLQDAFINTCRKEKCGVTIFLVNGVKLSGVIVWYDRYSILLRRDNHNQLVYKHAISTIMPLENIVIVEENVEATASENSKLPT
ncbi:MAG: RNA chaperone Hfq [Rhodobacteraceae bacterium]|nr:RNA chaperone Hfq [Paracoccaceae bacterium]